VSINKTECDLTTWVPMIKTYSIPVFSVTEIKVY